MEMHRNIYTDILFFLYLSLAPKIALCDDFFPSTVANISQAEKLINDKDSDVAFKYLALGEERKVSTDVANRMRISCDRTNNHSIAVIYGTGGTPRSVHYDDILYLLDSKHKSWIAYNDFKWRFQFNAESFSNPLGRKRVKQNKTPEIRVDIAGFFKMVLGNTPEQEKWDSISRVYEQRSAVGDVVFIRYRDDIDANQFGVKWSSIGGITRDGAKFILLCPCTKKLPYARLAIKCEKQIEHVVNVDVYNPDASSITTNLGHIESDESTNAHLMHLALHQIKDQTHNRVLSVENEVILVEIMAKQSLGTYNSDKIKGTLSCDAFATSLNRLADKLTQSITSEASCPNDPHMKWLRSEYLIGPKRLYLIYLQASTFLATKSATKSARAKLIEALATLGSPIPGFTDEEFRPSIQGDFEEAVFRSRTSLPCGEKHRIACANLLDNPNITDDISDIAVQTLLMLDVQPGQIPADRLGVWMQRRVVNASPLSRNRLFNELRSCQTAKNLVAENFE